ncbi:unnamed protein product, partial [Mesorhabditis spiculigera]
MRNFLVVCCFIAVALGQTAFYPVTPGERVQLDIPDAKSYKRTLRSGGEQLFKICPNEDDLSPKCTHWTQNGTLLSTTSKVRGFKNGTLVIEKVTASDLGSYWSPEVEMIVRERFPDGSPKIAVNGPVITLILKEN